MHLVRGRATFGVRMVGLVRLACERGAVSKPASSSDDHALDTLNFLACALPSHVLGSRAVWRSKGAVGTRGKRFIGAPHVCTLSGSTLPAGSPQASPPSQHRQRAQ